MVLVQGNRDLPGKALLTRMHPNLEVGNEMAASFAETRYAVVLSTVIPKHHVTFAPRPELSTLTFHWRDDCGRETPAAEQIARRNIVDGARALAGALETLDGDDRKALVHCAYGQNRSNAVCVCYAILFRAWSPQAAIDYARDVCLRDRSYANPRPLHNDVFVNFLLSLTPATDGTLSARPSTLLDKWLLGGGSSTTTDDDDH